jgi:hypothetical protein
VVRYYGTPVKVGEGIARANVLINNPDRETPLEVDAWAHEFLVGLTELVWRE